MSMETMERRKKGAPSNSTWEVSSKEKGGKSRLRNNGVVGIAGGCHSGMGDVRGLCGASLAMGEMLKERGNALRGTNDTLGCGSRDDGRDVGDAGLGSAIVLGDASQGADELRCNKRDDVQSRLSDLGGHVGARRGDTLGMFDKIKIEERAGVLLNFVAYILNFSLQFS
ncbi:unnamed protein product [Ilex paraguariensis]|uniref:Uncharacterized protein n=1 Tax=Ilex paraguariensis TaxID=185542 RepID=A0ABC8S4K4_9AQUA